MNTLFYNTYIWDSSRTFKRDMDTEGMRDILQIQNSAEFLAHLNHRYSQYSPNEGGAVISSRLTETEVELNALFKDYALRIKSSFPDDTIKQYLHILDWEVETEKTINRISSDTSRARWFSVDMIYNVRNFAAVYREQLFPLPHFSDTKEVDRLTDLYKKNSQRSNHSPLAAEMEKCCRNAVARIRRYLPEISYSDAKLIWIRNSYTVATNIMVKPTISNYWNIGFDYNHFNFWQMVRQMEQTTVESLVKSNRRTESDFKRYLLDKTNSPAILKELHSIMKGRKGKQAVLVMLAAYKAGLTAKARIPYSLMYQEFGDIGAESGYHKYFADPPESWEYANITAHLKKKFSEE